MSNSIRPSNPIQHTGPNSFLCLSNIMVLMGIDACVCLDVLVSDLALMTNIDKLVPVVMLKLVDLPLSGHVAEDDSGTCCS